MCWSTEFAWARRRFVVVKTKAGAAWADAPHPLTSTVVTVGGLIAAAVAIVAVRHVAVVAASAT